MLITVIMIMKITIMMTIFLEHIHQLHFLIHVRVQVPSNKSMHSTTLVNLFFKLVFHLDIHLINLFFNLADYNHMLFTKK